MSLALSSDLILDVARAAEPSRVKAAVARLEAGAESGFAQALARAGQAVGAAESDLRTRLAEMTSSPLSRVKERQSPGAAFESMMLQVFMQNMLPQSSKIFGKGAAGGAYKSFLAEQLAGQLSKAGGIGVAKLIDTRVAAIQAARQTAVAKTSPGA